MPGQGKDVSAAGTQTDGDLGFSFEDLQAELRRIHKERHPERRPGEFTVSDYAQVNGLEIESARSILKYLLREGVIRRPEDGDKRLINGKFTVVFVLVKPDDGPKIN
jgi:hypothetical protein